MVQNEMDHTVDTDIHHTVDFLKSKKGLGDWVAELLHIQCRGSCINVF